ncbi:MAG: AAA family ATPase, partial [Eubacteriales bacterium]|nr:AAA family ATPase [Eubacteriales bacterium]
KIVLPKLGDGLSLTDDERIVYNLLSKTSLKPISDIVPFVEFGKSKTSLLLKRLVEKGIVEIKGQGKGTRYIRK